MRLLDIVNPELCCFAGFALPVDGYTPFQTSKATVVGTSQVAEMLC